MTPLLRKILGMNWVLVLTMYGLLVFGVIAIESAARHIPVDGVPEGASGAYFAGKQKIWILIGSLVYFATALIDYRWLKWLGIPMYGIGLALLVYLLGTALLFLGFVTVSESVGFEDKRAAQTAHP